MIRKPASGEYRYPETGKSASRREEREAGLRIASMTDMAALPIKCSLSWPRTGSATVLVNGKVRIAWWVPANAAVAA